MTLIEFIKSHISHESAVGDLAEEVMNDKNFPYKKDEKAILTYLEFVSRSRGNSDAFEALVEGYRACRNVPVGLTDLDVHYNPLRVENWGYLKEYFIADRAILVGKPGDLYQVYAVDSVSECALKFEIYDRRQLNEVSIVELAEIAKGEIIFEVSISEAISAIETIKFGSSRQPSEPGFSEMVSYLKNLR